MVNGGIGLCLIGSQFARGLGIQIYFSKLTLYFQKSNLVQPASNPFPGSGYEPGPCPVYKTRTKNR